MKLLTWLRGLWNWRRARSLGERGEAAAAWYLRWRGYRIVARRQRDRLGELDLIAVQGQTIVFVEVKTRRGTHGDHPAEAVTLEKQRRIVRTALAFLKRHDLLEYPVRFDVIAVTWPTRRWRPRVEHLLGAFESTDQGQMFS